MKHYCQCTIKRFAKATCQHMVIVPTFSTSLVPSTSTTTNVDIKMIEDGETKFCNIGGRFCPHKIVVPIHEHDLPPEQ